MFEALILLLQLKSMSLLTGVTPGKFGPTVACALVFIEAMLIYSGWEGSGEMDEIDLDLNLACSNDDDLLGDFLFSLLEFLDLDC